MSTMNRLIILDQSVIKSAAMNSDPHSITLVYRVIAGDLMSILSLAIIRSYLDILSQPVFKNVTLPWTWLKVLINQAHLFPNNLMFLDLAKYTGAVLISHEPKHFLCEKTGSMTPEKYLSLLASNL